MEKNQTDVKKASPVKKGTVKTEIIIGAGAAKLASAVKLLKDSVVVLDRLEDDAEELAINIAAKEDRLAQLDTEFAEKKRQLAVALEIESKADITKVVNTHLDTAGLVAISKEEKDRINNEYNKLKNDFDKEVNSKVAAATSAQKKDHENDLRVREAEYKAKEAENLAKINNLEAQLKSEKETVAMLIKQLDAERTASVERARASSIGSVNVSSGK